MLYILTNGTYVLKKCMVGKHLIGHLDQPWTARQLRAFPLLHCAATLVSPPPKSPSPPTSTPFPSSPSSPASPSPHTSSNPSSSPSSALEVFASPPCNASSGAPFQFDPLPWVQYYGLASQQGEIDADMALSTRFLCGAKRRGRTKGSRWAWMWYTRVSSQYAFISVWSTLIVSSRQRIMARRL